MRRLVLIAFLLLPHVLAAKPVQTERHAVDYQIVAEGLQHPEERDAVRDKLGRDAIVKGRSYRGPQRD